MDPLSLFEIDFELSDSRRELEKKVRWIIRVRYAVSAGVVLLMFFTGWQGLTQKQALTEASVFATVVTGGVAVLLNILYVIALRRQRDLQAFVYLQLLVDVVIFSSYVYRSGGVTSPFSFLYLLPIITAGMILSGRAVLAVAAFAALCYSLVAILPAVGLIEHVSYFVALDSFARKWPYVVLMLLISPIAFLTVAALTGFLMRTVRQKAQQLAEANGLLDRRAALLTMLYRVSRSAVDEPDGEHVIDRVGEILVQGLNLDRVLLYLVDPTGEKLRLKREFYHPRLEGKVDRAGLQVELPLDEQAGVTARCAVRRRAENVRDPAKHTLINQQLAQQIGINPFAVAPMVARGELMGVLGIDRKTECGVIDDDDFAVLIAFADQAAATLFTARLEQRR